MSWNYVLIISTPPLPSPASLPSPHKYKQSWLWPTIRSCLERTTIQLVICTAKRRSFGLIYTRLSDHLTQDKFTSRPVWLLLILTCWVMDNFISYQASQQNSKSFLRLQPTRKIFDEERIFKLNISVPRPVAMIFLWVEMLDKILFLSSSHLARNNCKKMFWSWI